MKQKRTLPGLAALLLAAVPGIGGATTTTFQEGVAPDSGYVMDAVYIRSGQPNQNGDPDQEVLVGFSGTPFRGLLEFDVSEIPASDIIDSATLFLKTRDTGAGQGTGIQYDLYEYGFDIDETAATWAAPAVSDADPTDGGTLGALLGSVTFDSVNQAAEVTFADSPAFQTAIANALAGDGSVRFLIKATSETSGFARFADETWPDATFRPKLTVEHSPSGPDLTAPGIDTLSPADETSGGFYVGTDLVLTFDEDVALTGNGTITIVDTDDGSGTQVIALPNAAVTVVGDVLTIDPPSVLDTGTNYAVQISANAVVDLSTDNGGGPNAFPGILDNTTWNFTTDVNDPTGPQLDGVLPFLPADGATEVVLDEEPSVLFDENIVLGTGNITLRNLTTTTDILIPTTDTSQLAVDGALLTITPTNPLDAVTDYAILIDPGAVRNFSDVAFAGITDETTWNFSTASSTIFITSANSSGNDTWSQGGNWDIGLSPSGGLSATINPNLTATAEGTAATYSGGLTIQANSTLVLRDGAGTLNALGTGSITMGAGTQLTLLHNSPDNLAISNDIAFAGDTAIFNSGNGTDNEVRFLTGTLSGIGQLTYSMRRGNTLNIDGTNSSWSGGFVGNCSDIISSNLPNGIEPGVNNAFGTGDVTLNDGVRLVIPGGLSDTIDDGATLNLDGARARDGHKLVLGSDETVGLLNRNGFPYPSGTYGEIGSGATYEHSWISGSGILTVASDNGDATGPVTLALSPVDDAADAIISENLVIDFDEPVLIGTGNITIKNLTDATQVVIPVTNPFLVSISDETRVTIDPALSLITGKNYAIQIDAGAFVDLFGNDYLGIVDDTTWNFTTVTSKLVFFDDFENGLNDATADDATGGYSQTPDVNAAQSDGNTSGAVNTTLWVKANQGFGATRQGLIDESHGDFTDPAGEQAWGFRYTNSGLTTAEGVIGGLTAGTTYTITFDVVEDGHNGGTPWTAKLYTVNGGSRNDSRNDNLATKVLKTVTGNADAGGDYKQETFTYTVDASADSAVLGQDVTLRFRGATTSATIDNVSVTVGAETAAPTVVSIVDDVSGGPVAEGSTVTYTVTFDEAINAATVGTDDFENGSTAGITVDSVTPTANPAAYEVVVSAVSTGDLVLQIASGAVIEDGGGNALDTTSAIADDTTIAVTDGTAPTLTSIVDDVSGGPINSSDTVVYTVTFSEAMDAGTIGTDDFENGLGAGITLDGLVATGDPAVYELTVTAIADGDLRIQIKSGAVLTDLAGNALVTTTALQDDTTITVGAGGGSPFETWATGGETFDGDANGDGVQDGLAFLLGAATPGTDANGLLPTAQNIGGDLVLTFSMLNAANRGASTLAVQDSNDLGATDAWVSALVPEGPGSGIVVGVVSFDVTPNGSLNDVVATIPASEAAGGKLFGRLEAAE